MNKLGNLFTTSAVGVLFSVSSFAMSPTTSGVKVNKERNLAPEWRSEFNPLARSLQEKTDNSYVVLISFAPEKTISYANGKSLKDSMIALRGNDAGSVGHTMVGWQCSNGRSVVSRGLTALSGGNTRQVKKLRERGFGLLGALAVFTDGYLQTAKTPALNYKFSQVQKGAFKMKWIAVKVPHSSCGKVAKFRNRFKNSGAYRNFGFNLRPEKMEGAGCSSFARHLLYEAGILNNTARYWDRSLTVPYGLIARPPGGSIPENVKFRIPLKNLSPIPIEKKNLAFRSWSFNQQGFPLNFVDTELIYYTILEAEKMVKSGDRSKFPKSIKTGYRRVKQSVGGSSQRVPIDSNLDDKTRGIYSSLQENRLDTYDYSYSQINGVTGLILEGDLK